jgi:TRAP-type mannitol/chloroaromatic compound transport system substrate-binding protein
MGPMLQCTINGDAWQSLPPDLQSIVSNVCQAINDDMMAEYTWGNATALERIKADPNVELRQLPDDVLRLLKEISQQVLEEMAAGDEWAGRIKQSFDNFQRIAVPYHEISELAYMRARQL